VVSLGVLGALIILEKIFKHSPVVGVITIFVFFVAGIYFFQN
jgi:hypothetical protein